ncbi:PDDEXK nuclease domain-containing protein [Fluoribacter dumoffii]|uniref:PDDEXK nuclease domain-containing protein n=1 Tax=Fluoribacter dumoffii TaxID=463 RepID=UPI001E530A53|nr:PDDEXK nuclease domain-containing protein [Fluoribacter dumoffii]
MISYESQEITKTIGILLCKSKNKVIAEYALRNISALIGVFQNIPYQNQFLPT